MSLLLFLRSFTKNRTFKRMSLYMLIPEMTLHCLAIISFQCQSTSSDADTWTRPRTGRRLYPVEYSSLVPGFPRALSGVYDDGRYSTQDCLEGFRMCNSKQWICKIDLDIFKQFCGDWRNEKSLLACPRAYFKECRSALNTVLLGRPNLKHCTCDGQLSRSIEDVARCNLLRRNLNHHPCLMDQPVFGSQAEQSNGSDQPNFEKPTLITQNSPNPVEMSLPIESGKAFDQNSEHVLRAENLPNTTSTPALSQLNNREHGSPVSPIGMANHTATHPGQLLGREISGESAGDKTDWSLKPPGSGDRFGAEKSSEKPVPRAGLKSCLLFLDSCTKRPGCANALNNFRAVCNIRSCARLRSQCGKANKELQKYMSPWNCTCFAERSSHAKQRCQDFQSKISENMCVAEWKASVGVEGSSYDVDDGDNGDDDASHPGMSELIDRQLGQQTSAEQTKPVFAASQSRNQLGGAVDIAQQKAEQVRLNCFTVYMNCLRNNSCLRWYIELVKSCSPAHCLESVGCKTGGLPTIPLPKDSALAVHALTCQCRSNDRDCERQEKVLHMRCSPKPEISAKHCLNLWMKCRLKSKCRQDYQRLVTECQRTGQACTSNPLVCLELHRQLVVHSDARHCYCGPGNDSLVEGHWISGACTEFQSKLNQQPCSENTYVETPTGTATATSGTKMQACEITHKLHLPNTRVLKLKIDESAHHDCYAFCTCGLGCTRRACLSRNSISDIPGHLAGMEQIEKHVAKPPWLEFSAICLFLPSIDRTCLCVTDRYVKCTMSAKRNIKCGKDYQLEIDYQLAQLSMILSTNRERSAGERLQQIFQLVYMLVNQLAETVQRTVGSKACRLFATEFAWHYRADGHTEATNSSEDYAGLGELRSVFLLAAEAVVEDDSDCQLTLSLVETIINHRLPQMVYHPLLSALQSARTPESVESGNQCNGSDSSSSPQSLQSWRKPRSEGQPKSSGIRAHVHRFLSASVMSILFSCLWYAIPL